MSDNDLIRRGDAIALTCDPFGAETVTSQAINALPAAQPTVKPLRYIEPEGETLEQMRGHARQHPLAQAGDMRLVWVNEGDLHMHTIFHAEQPTVSPDVAALVETLDRTTSLGQRSEYSRVGHHLNEASWHVHLAGFKCRGDAEAFLTAALARVKGDAK